MRKLLTWGIIILLSSIIMNLLGPSADIFPVGVSGPPGVQEDQDMSWCQVRCMLEETIT